MKRLGNENRVIPPEKVIVSLRFTDWKQNKNLPLIKGILKRTCL